MRLSDEQERAVDRAAGGADGAVVARAGSGKTHTLRAIAEATAPRPGLLLAFNRAIAREASSRFPAHVRATTLHALAYRAVIGRDAALRRKFRVADGRIPTPTWVELAELSPNDPDLHDHVVQMRALMAGFCASAADEPADEHLPAALRTQLTARLGAERSRDRVRWLTRRVGRVWERVTDPTDPAPLDHDAYLKLFARRRAPLDAEVLLVDEAQDLAPVMMVILERQSAQTVLVGDPAQRIYGFRGAIDAMAASGLPDVRLTRSFRFGPEIADVARRVLAVVAGEARLTGAGREGRVLTEPYDEAVRRTVLCRGNAGLIDAALSLGERPVHVVGGTRAMTTLLRAVYELRAGTKPERAVPELAGIADWDAFERAADAQGGTLRMLHRLLLRHGERVPALCRALDAAQTAREEDAQVVLSTVHKAKGREWDRVELWSDLPRIPGDRRALRAAPDPDAARAEANLLYVAVTRARRELNVARVGEELRALLTGSDAAEA